MIELTQEQVQALDQPPQPPVAVDPRTGKEYLLISREIYEKVRSTLQTSGRGWENSGDDDLLQSPANSEMGKWAAKFRALKELRDGWNSYSAPAPPPASNDNAYRFFVDANIPPTRIAPSAVGGVGITYRHGSRKVYVEFFNDGRANGLFADDATQNAHTLPVDAGQANAFAQRIMEYIHG
jgi:hypothetical protein